MDPINNTSLISGLVITPLKQIIDDRGGVFHVMKKSDSAFIQFGEVYFSKINFGYIKAWKFHKKMTQNFSVPFGKLKLVIFDNRIDSLTKGVYNEFLLDSEINYNLITIPKQLWYGFKCIEPNYCLLLNIASLEHNQEESISLDIDNDLFTYKWK